MTSPLNTALKTDTSLIENEVILHFGDPESELSAWEHQAVSCAIPPWIRLQVSGNDRARFLHNFCTNDISGLPVGTACEAIFTDVKARIIGHGYILAGDEHHEIWMLPGDEERLSSHLSRYIITEDVAIASLSHTNATVALAGPDALQAAALANLPIAPELNGHLTADSLTTLRLQWAGRPLLLISAGIDVLVDRWRQLNSDSVAAGSQVFDHVRILEGFPIVGRDLSDGNLAPEAGRNAQAISYVKGCYLGQEPIARIDAMGHVNRQIFRLHATQSDEPAPQQSAALTSMSHIQKPSIPALSLVTVKEANGKEPILLEGPNRRAFKVTVVHDER